MPKKGALKSCSRFFCGDICTKNTVKCRTVFFPRSLALANRRHFGETSKVPIGKSSLRIPENMCVHVLKKMQPSSTNNSYLIWYIHLCMYFLVYIHSLVSCFMSTFYYLVCFFIHLSMVLFLDSIYNVTCFQIRVSKLQAGFWSP